LLIINSAQALLFLFLSYAGLRTGLGILAAGYFLHGGWDLAYGWFENSGLLPPGYDLFCMSLDFVLGIHLIAAGKRMDTSLAAPPQHKKVFGRNI
jgi:hypothetical protein